MDGQSPTEYQLIRLHQSGSYREFRSMTTGAVSRARMFASYEVAMPKVSICRLLAVCLLAVATLACVAQEGPLPDPAHVSLDNAAILKMSGAGLNEDLIIQTIRTQPGSYAIGVDDLVALKKAGVSDRIIAAMAARAAAVLPPPAPVKELLPPGVEDIGVYWQNHDGQWTRMSPEIVNYKSSNLLVPLVTHGIVRENQNGHIEGGSSSLKVTNPVHIILYISEGNEPEEYMLLKLKASSKAREFRSSTGGVFHSRTGASQDTIDFTASRIAPHVYEFTLPPNTKPGEYGILPPGAVRSANAASGGKIYTFHLVE